MTEKTDAPAPKPLRKITLHTRFAVMGEGDAFTVHDAGAVLIVGTDIPADQADAAIASGAASA